MALTTLYDSFLNPVKFHKLDNVQPSNYLSRFMDDWAFRRTIQPWDQKVCFYQPWSQYDEINLQYTSDVGPIILRLYDEEGILKDTASFQTKNQDELRPTFFVRQITRALASFPPGKYFFTRDVAGMITYSEPIEIIDSENSGICLENQDPTLYIEYSHDVAAQGLKFFVPFAPTIRTPGILRYESPGAKDNVYEDQLLNVTMINSVPYRIWKLIIGGNYGVPPYFIDKIARILSLPNVKIDGRLFTKNEGANFEPAFLEGYPMQGWSIELREKLNRDSQIIQDDIVIEGLAAASLLIDAKGFGIDGGDDNYQAIQYLQ